MSMSASSESPALSAPVVCFDGKSARSQAATLSVEGPDLVCRDEAGVELTRFGRTSVGVVDDGIEGPSRILTSTQQPDVRIKFASPDLAAPFLAWSAKPAGRTRLAAKPRILALAAVGAVAAGFVATKAIPLLATPITAMIPMSYEVSVGQELVPYHVPEKRRCTEAEGLAVIASVARQLLASESVNPPFTVYAIDNDEPNAFVFAGNHLVVQTGLIKHAPGPEAVVGVIAHELGHQLHRHAMRRMIINGGTTFLFGAIFGGLTPESVATMGATQYRLRFSRDAEREADATAVRLLNRAGFGTDGLTVMFRRFAELRGEPHVFATYFSSHPLEEERI